MPKKGSNIKVKGQVNIGGVIKKKPIQNDWDRYRTAASGSPETVR